MPYFTRYGGGYQKERLEVQGQLHFPMGWLRVSQKVTTITTPIKRPLFRTIICNLKNEVSLCRKPTFSAPAHRSHKTMKILVDVLPPGVKWIGKVPDAYANHDNLLTQYPSKSCDINPCGKKFYSFLETNRNH